MEGVEEFQDLGDLESKNRTIGSVGPSGVEPLVPDDDSTFRESTEAFREVLDEHYGDRLDKLTRDGEELIIERVVVQADEVPYIEYTVVEAFDDE